MGNALAPVPFTFFQHSSNSKCLILPSTVTVLKVPLLCLQIPIVYPNFTQIEFLTDVLAVLHVSFGLFRIM